MKPPAFQFYPDDFIGGTVALTTVDVGAYVRLLCYQWGQGKIPSDKEEVDRVAGCTVSDKVLEKFPSGRNKRLESERKKQRDYREKQRQNGIASGIARRSTTVHPPLNHRSTKPEPRAVEPNTNSPSPSPSPDSIKDDRENAPPVELPVGFPKNEAEAKAVAGFVGCTEDFCVETWNKAFARGGRDAKDIPIRSWQHYLKSEKTFGTNRTEREKSRPVFRNGKSQVKPDYSKPW